MGASGRLGDHRQDFISLREEAMELLTPSLQQFQEKPLENGGGTYSVYCG